MRELDEGAFPQAGDDRVVIGSAGLPTTSISMGDGNDCFQGGPEDDGGGGTMGDDVLKMGGGNDGRGYVLGVSEGADLIEGEGGTDGDAGNDVLDADADALYGDRDGDQVDELTCGAGDDWVRPGPGDLVASDCENIVEEVSCPSGACDGVLTTVAEVPSTAKSASGRSLNLRAADERVLLGKTTFAFRGKKRVILELRRRQVRSVLRDSDEVPVLKKLTIDTGRSHSSKREPGSSCDAVEELSDHRVSRPISARFSHLQPKP